MIILYYFQVLLNLLQIDVWLKKNSHPRLPLPNICGYIPMTKYISNKLLKKKIENSEITEK